MKKLIFLSFALPGIVACNKDKKKMPEEYFSFYADGVYYDYPQEKGSSLFVDWKTLGAGRTSATVGYQIHAYSRKNPVAEGTFLFSFSGNHIPTQDTILLDGIANAVGIEKFKVMENNYELKQPLSGKIIFTERTSDKLTGTFAFDAYKMRVEGNNWVPTDSIIHITEGKFSIIPSN